MIDNLCIENFRGIRYSNIEKLNRVNVLFGKNNCGKSTLLESIFLLTGMSNPQVINNLNKYRNYNNMTEDDLKLFFYNLKAKGNSRIKISGSTENVKRNLDILLSSSNTVEEYMSDNNIPTPVSNSTKLKKGLKFNFSVTNGSKKSYSSELVLQENLNKEQDVVSYVYDKNYKEDMLSVYIYPNFMTSPNRSLEIVIANKKEKNIVDVLKKIDNRIENINVINGNIMIDIGLEKLVPINVLGDGIKKLLVILSGIYYLILAGDNNLILLIDEIENGLHYTSMTPLWKEIFAIAIEKTYKFLQQLIV